MVISIKHTFKLFVIRYFFPANILSIEPAVNGAATS